VTNNLIKLADDVTGEGFPTEREMDVLLATGEQTTIAAERVSNPYLREFNGGSATAMPTRGM
jgi:hypothetical protein